MHSPTKSSSLDKLVTAGGSSSSQPDLSKLDAMEVESKTMYLRKRKAPENDFTNQFNEFKKEILSVLKESSKCNSDNINTISQNITSIKEQLGDITTTTDYLITENINLKSQITTLTQTVKQNEGKITCLQTEIQQLKTAPTASFPSLAKPAPYENLIFELQERAERSKNIVIAGLAEKHSVNSVERQENDRREVENIIKSINPNCKEVERVIRLGKYENNKIRPLKVCFASHETVKIILRNKLNVKLDGVRIYSDQTPQQQQFMINLKKELQQRQESGEEDLTIKYIKGIPKIIKQSKN